MNRIEFFTVGYGYWPVPRRMKSLLDVLNDNRIELLIDIRHSPCSSNLDPTNSYGPRDWHLRTDSSGIISRLQPLGIGYRWLVELGNPQKTDPAMTILRQHLADTGNAWPVHRGLELISKLIRDDGHRCCLMCACDDYDDCHRKLIAEALASILGPNTHHGDLAR